MNKCSHKLRVSTRKLYHALGEGYAPVAAYPLKKVLSSGCQSVLPRLYSISATAPPTNSRVTAAKRMPSKTFPRFIRLDQRLIALGRFPRQFGPRTLFPLGRGGGRSNPAPFLMELRRRGRDGSQVTPSPYRRECKWGARHSDAVKFLIRLARSRCSAFRLGRSRANQPFTIIIR